MYSFKVRIRTDDITVTEQRVDLSTLIEWRDRGIVSSEDEVWSEWFTGGQWKKLRDVDFGRSSTERGLKNDGTPAVRTEPAASAKFCSNCGVSIQTGVKFCSNCGASVTLPSPSRSARDPRFSYAEPVWQPKCHYCQSEMDAEAIKCPRCGKYLREIEKDKGIYRVFGYSAVALSVLWLWVLLDNKYAFQTNSDYRTRMWLFGIGCMVIGCFSIPAWIRVGKRTGEWFWF
jgi:hypothetical protein